MYPKLTWSQSIFLHVGNSSLKCYPLYSYIWCLKGLEHLPKSVLCDTCLVIIHSGYPILIWYLFGTNWILSTGMECLKLTLGCKDLRMKIQNSDCQLELAPWDSYMRPGHYLLTFLWKNLGHKKPSSWVSVISGRPISFFSYRLIPIQADKYNFRIGRYR